MALEIPVFFFPIEKSAVSSPIKSWRDAIPLLADRVNEPEKYGVRNTSSRSWWHQYALQMICDAFEIKGLEFTLLEVAMLDADELNTAVTAIDALQQRAEDIPALDVVKDSFLGHDFFVPEHNAAIKEAESSYRIDSPDFGYEAMIAFWSFVMTLKIAISDALSSDKSLLYIRIPG